MNVSDKLMNHISANAQTMFQSSVRLFPPGFPLTAESSNSNFDFEGLSELVEDLNSRLEHLDIKLSQLNSNSNSIFRENID